MNKQTIPPFVCQLQDEDTKLSLCFRLIERYCYLCKKGYCQDHSDTHGCPTITEKFEI